MKKNEKQSELAEIEKLRKQNPEIFSRRDIEEIESDFHDFMIELGALIGLKGKPCHNGVWNKKIADAYRLYFDPNKGGELRGKMDVHGFRLPKDFEDLQLIHSLRKIKTAKGVDYQTALDIMSARALRKLEQNANHHSHP